MILDRNIDWLRKKVRIPVLPMEGYAGVVTPHVFISGGVGANLHQAINSLAIHGLVFAADADAHHFMVPVPYDVDPASEMGFMVNWTNGSSTVGDSVLWTILCDFKATDATVALATTALDTILVDDNALATAYQNQWTSRGIKDAAFLTEAQIRSGALMMLSLVSTTLTDITEDIFPLFIQYDYKVKSCGSSQVATQF